MKRPGKFYIGTSGWHYKHWRLTVYPGGLKEKDQFRYYKTLLSTVEINNSFYKLPLPTTFMAWKEQAPPGFVYAVKAPRFFTQAKKLMVAKPDLEEFIHRCKLLGRKLGVILIQLPPRWKINAGRLESFLEMLPAGLRYAFEFREPTWYDPVIYELLKKYKAAFCIYELDGHQSPQIVTTSFVYIRLHGPGAKYQGSYDDATLKSWAKKMKTWQKEGKDVYIYFDNDQEGYAAQNATRLKKLTGS